MSTPRQSDSEVYRAPRFIWLERLRRTHESLPDSSSNLFCLKHNFVCVRVLIFVHAFFPLHFFLGYHHLEKIKFLKIPHGCTGGEQAAECCGEHSSKTWKSSNERMTSNYFRCPSSRVWKCQYGIRHDRCTTSQYAENNYSSQQCRKSMCVCLWWGCVCMCGIDTSH